MCAVGTIIGNSDFFASFRIRVEIAAVNIGLVKTTSYREKKSDKEKNHG